MQEDREEEEGGARDREHVRGRAVVGFVEGGPVKAAQPEDDQEEDDEPGVIDRDPDAAYTEERDSAAAHGGKASPCPKCRLRNAGSFPGSRPRPHPRSRPRPTPPGCASAWRRSARSNALLLPRGNGGRLGGWGVGGGVRGPPLSQSRRSPRPPEPTPVPHAPPP